MRVVRKPMRRVVAAEEPEATVDVTPEATELLFETEDVAQLLAEVTDSEVTADVDSESDSVVFTVDGDEYTVEPDGDEEILETSRRQFRGKKSVRASSRARGAKVRSRSTARRARRV